MIHDRNRIRLRTACVNQRGEEVLSGEAWVMPSRTPVVYESRRNGLAALATLPLTPWTLAAQTMAAWSALGLALMRRRARYINRPPLIDTSAPVM